MYCFFKQKYIIATQIVNHTLTDTFKNALVLLNT